MNELILELQRAHAGEWAAYLAYEGHWKAIARSGDMYAASEIHRIQKEEWYHRQAVGFMLHELGSSHNPTRDALMGLIGRTASALCYVVPAKHSALGARIIETLGKNEYRKMAKMAMKLGKFRMGRELLRMAAVEEEHEKFFRQQ